MRAAWPLLLAVGLALPLAFAENVVHHPGLGVADGTVIVAVLDTGIAPGHAEFASGQVVAWWDFHASLVPTGTWMATPAPHDGHGHGTATAALVGGATVGAYPGVKLAIGKITDGSGNVRDGAISAAIAWARDVVGADVISISAGYTVPTPGTFDTEDEEATRADRAGALVVASAGNGVLNIAPRYSGTLHPPSSTPSALMVGAVGRTGRWTSTDTALWSYYSNTEPDVVAWGTFVCTARAPGTGMAVTTAWCKGGNPAYGETSGTSFATPLVSGWSARAMQAAMDAGQDASPARIKSLILGTAVDDVRIPYSLEGRGYVNGFVKPSYLPCPTCDFGADTVSAAVALAASGAAAPSAGLEAGASEAAFLAARRLFTETLDRQLLWLGTPHSGNGALRLGAGAAMAQDAETWTFSAARGDRIQIWVNATEWAPFLSNPDLALFPPGTVGLSPRLYDREQVAAESDALPSNGVTREVVDVRAYATGVHTVVVHGPARAGGLNFSLDVRVNGAPVAAAYGGDELHVPFHVA